MTAKLTSLPALEVAERLKAGRALLIDIRASDEFARRHAAGALSRPLSSFETAHLKIEPAKDVIFTCRSGMRTSANCARLGAAVDGEAFVLDGGLDAWAAAGLPIEQNQKAPLEMVRQVQIAAGLLVLAGVLLGVSVHPAFFGLSAFVGAGLTFAGVTGFCGMARLLLAAPWNRQARA
jgi:rhodanese-related sulfurtransferase